MNSDIKYQDPQGFDPEIIQIERDLIDFLVDRMVNVSRRDPIVSKVMTIFYTRKELTQQELQILTNYSAGTISKTVRQLIDMKMITRNIIPGTHKHIYKMEKLPYGSPSYIMNAGQMMIGMTDEIKSMKEILDKNKEEMKDLEGFEKVYSIISQLSMILTTVPKFMKILENELDEYIKKFS
jgi:DNA-binding transcriptional regulator GbsR (MarR family)